MISHEGNFGDFCSRQRAGAAYFVSLNSDILACVICVAPHLTAFVFHPFSNGTCKFLTETVTVSII